MICLKNIDTLANTSYALQTMFDAKQNPISNYMFASSYIIFCHLTNDNLTDRKYALNIGIIKNTYQNYS